jgi:signal transduction histidine kinase
MWEACLVVTMTEVLEVNWIILYFVYGQVFFIMGLVTGLQWRRNSHLELARPLPWLAAFGIAHGLNEWGYIFIPLQAIYLEAGIVQLMVTAHLLLLAISYFFLFQFGVELILPLLPRQRWLRALPGATLILWAIAVFLRGALAQEPLNILSAIAEGWSRYLLCLPGATLAGMGLFRQARHVRRLGLLRIASYLTGAAIAFLVYALVGGLIVPTAPVFPATLVNYALLNRTIRIPPAIFRSLCGLAMAFFIVRSLEIFQVEDDRRIAEMERSQTLAEDRIRIGRELHDGIIQSIYAAGLSLEDARHLVSEDPDEAQSRIQSVMAALNQTIQDIRRYIFDLRPREQSRELEVLLEDLVQELRLDTMLEVELEMEGERCCWLGEEALGHVTQIAREALSNAVQHSAASRIKVGLSYEGESTTLVVSDDGKGLSAYSLAGSAAHQGHGVANMRDRARMLGGTLALEANPGGGLRLTLAFPCGGKAQVDEDMLVREAGA